MRIRLILPFRLPTWNQLLAMNRWERKEVRTWIKEQVYMCIHGQKDSLIQTGGVARLSLTDWSKQAYLQMIIPNSSAKYRNHKKLQKMKKKQL